jgi:transcriptional regulator with XRE-family HTH domain
MRGETPALIDRLRATRLPPPAVRRARRRDAGATLRDVAEELNVSEASVSCWERGLYSPSPRHVGAYLQLLRAFELIALEQDCSDRSEAEAAC